MADLYSILQVPKTATDDEIKKSYRKLARQYHPDVNQSPDAESKFKELQGAFDVLGTPELRKEYDQFGEIKSKKGYHRDPYNDFFSSFFKQAPYQGEAGDHIMKDISITLEQVASGCDFDLAYKRKKLCEECDGKGGEQVMCRRCDGSGIEILHGGNNISIRHTCSACKGNGKTVSEKCKGCNGTGWNDDYIHNVVVAIPPGVETGNQMKFNALGNPGRNGGRPGHLVITIHIKPHHLFSRISKGDLGIKYPVSFSQLVFGDEVEIPNILGENLTVRIPAGTQPGTKMRLSKQGLPTKHSIGEHLQPLDPGDLYVEMKLEVPTTDLGSEFIRIVCELEEFDKNETYYPNRHKFLKEITKV